MRPSDVMDFVDSFDLRKPVSERDGWITFGHGGPKLRGKWLSGYKGFRSMTVLASLYPELLER